MPDEINPNPEVVSGQDVSRQPFDQSMYTLDVEQASALFLAAGVPRSPRTLDRYCKSGHLACMKIDTERNEKYLITQESVTARIKELQQVIPSGHVQTQRDMSGHVQSQPDMSRHAATDDQITDEEKKKFEERIKELERENLDLKITNRGKDYFVEKLEKEREYFEVVRREMTQQLISQSQRVGELKTKLQQIEAPQREEPNTAEHEHGSNVIDVTPENTQSEETHEQSNNIFQ